MTGKEKCKLAGAGFLPALLLAFSVAGAPAHAHGDEQHGEAASATQPAEPSGHDEAMSSGEMARGAPEDGHGGGGGGHGEAAGGHAENPKSPIAVLKKLHPATIHFPIALFLMAALTELFVMARRTPDREAAVRIMLYGGAAGALVAVLFGWIHTGLWWGGDAVMQFHRWNGMLLAGLGALAAWIAYRQPQARGLLRMLIFSLALLVLVQGFLGGELAHGPDHLKIF